MVYRPMKNYRWTRTNFFREVAKMGKQTSFILSAAGASALAALWMIGPVHAKSAAEWTCSEFVQTPDSNKANVIYFMAGLHKADKLTSGDVTGKDFKKPVKMKELVDICRKDQSQNLWDALARHFYWRAMQLP
jgi:HdeA/HdeB family